MMFIWQSGQPRMGRRGEGTGENHGWTRMNTDGEGGGVEEPGPLGERALPLGLRHFKNCCSRARLAR